MGVSVCGGVFFIRHLSSKLNIWSTHWYLCVQSVRIHINILKIIVVVNHRHHLLLNGFSILLGDFYF